MLHHVSVGVADVARAAKFYDAVLGALGYKRVMDFSPGAIAYGEERDRPEFWIGLPIDRKLPSGGNGSHVSFSARSKQAVMKFHALALQHGASNDGEPGPRPDYGPDYYGAFVYDLDGNKIEATLHPAPSMAKPRAKKAVKARSKRKAAKKAKTVPKKSAKKPPKKTKRRARKR